MNTGAFEEGQQTGGGKVIGQVPPALRNPSRPNRIVKAADGACHRGLQLIVTVADARIGQGAVIVEMLVDAIGKEQAEFRTAPELDIETLDFRGAPRRTKARELA